MDTTLVKLVGLVAEIQPHMMAVSTWGLWGGIGTTLFILFTGVKVLNLFRDKPLQVTIVKTEEVCWYHRKFKGKEHRGCGCPKDSPPQPRE